jgi:hypothetical protein
MRDKSFNIGAALAGGGGERRPNDFYPTPWEATVALLKVTDFPRCVWEPACGNGAMARVLEAFGHKVHESDIEADFTKVETHPFGCAREFAIITNPPFKLAAKFIEKALSFTPHVAMLLKSQFLHAASRLPLYEKHPPCHVFPLTWRLDFTNGGAPTMDCAWFVWGQHMLAKFRPLPKPAPHEHPVFQ